MSNSLDPDQAQHSVGPDLGPNCLQRSAVDDKICGWQTEFCFTFTLWSRDQEKIEKGAVDQW